MKETSNLPTCARPCFERPCFETDPSIWLVPNRSLSVFLKPASFTSNLGCLSSSKRSSFRVSAFPFSDPKQWPAVGEHEYLILNKSNVLICIITMCYAAQEWSPASEQEQSCGVHKQQCFIFEHEQNHICAQGPCLSCVRE